MVSFYLSDYKKLNANFSRIPENENLNSVTTTCSKFQVSDLLTYELEIISTIHFSLINVHY